MSYTNRQAVKTHLGITSTSYDDIIDELVFDSKVEIDISLDIDGLGTGTKTELVRFRNITVHD